jgi:hypothetical protein
MKKTVSIKTPLFSFSSPLTSIIVTMMMLASLAIFGILFFHHQNWITLPF